MPSVTQPESKTHPFNVAVVGGGIVGLITTLGLLRRGIPMTIYEQASDFREIGAGVAFTAAAQKCMELLDPQVLRALRKSMVSRLRMNGRKRMTFFFRIYSGDKKFDACHRAHFLEELVRCLPPGLVQFRKRLETYVDEEGHDKLRGIKSRVRRAMFGEQNPVSYAHYSHKVAFRSMAHLLHYPVAQHTMINVVAFVDDPSEWAMEEMSVTSSRVEASEAFADWKPAVRGLVGRLPEELIKWAIFDTYDHPAPTYSRRRVCLAGDAAHASSPHQEAGAAFGVEDALALATRRIWSFDIDKMVQEVEDGYQRHIPIKPRPRSGWAPRRWQRPIGENEAMIKMIGDQGRRFGKDVWSISVTAEVEVDSSQGSTEQLLRDGWKTLRFHHSSIASFINEDEPNTIVYEVPGALAFNQWAADAFVCVETEESPNDVVARMSPQRFTTLHYLPNTKPSF
ncbi:hypothetical protein BDW74DRAFT_172333 [Aspergillus multicolor]|uniref:FAD-dependent oxidoreductase n=1 Tax=Aspergillus multicolor TaxID=41759 RepID=UPI003CCD7649